MKTPQWYHGGSKTFRYASNIGTFIMIRNRIQLCCQFLVHKKIKLIIPNRHGSALWEAYGIRIRIGDAISGLGGKKRKTVPTVPLHYEVITERE